MIKTQTTQSVDKAPHYARCKAASKYFAVSKSTLWTWVKRPNFPKPIKAGEKTTLFCIPEIELYLQSQDCNLGLKDGQNT
jgi:predicted DNA-binding transcriptional regulator AlpA